MPQVTEVFLVGESSTYIYQDVKHVVGFLFWRGGIFRGVSHVCKLLFRFWG
jgi:hypothetical protein